MLVRASVLAVVVSDVRPSPRSTPVVHRSPGWVWVRVVGRGRNVSRPRNHHGRGRGPDGAEEGEPDPGGDVNASAGLPACVLEAPAPSTGRRVCLSGPTRSPKATAAARGASGGPQLPGPSPDVITLVC